MLNNEALSSIIGMLEEDYSNYADLLTSYIIRQQKKSTHVVGIIGDDLVGKSTIINLILGQDILPTSPIPSSSEITIKYGSNNKVMDEFGDDIEDYDLTKLSEESNGFTLEINNEYLNNNHLILKEFHGLLSKQKINDVNLMTEVYKCDAIVIVMSAQHLFSELECSFIKNYIKYVGSAHLLLIINKLSNVEKSDIGRVLEFASSQINSKFKSVKWTVNKNLDENNLAIDKYSTKHPRELIPSLFDDNEAENDDAIRNILHYVSEQLNKDIEVLQREKDNQLEEIEKKNNKIKQQRELDQTSVEMSLVELRHRSNETEEVIDEYIRKMFEDITSDLLNQYEKTSNKVKWYENELDGKWRESVSAMSDGVERLIFNRIESDIDWLNGIFETKLGVNTIPVKVDDKEISSSDKINSYSNYKKFAIIGIGGGVVIGYCLFRIIGAVVGLGGGLIAYTYVGLKESEQNEEIKKSIKEKVRDISLETRKVIKKEIERLYIDILNEYKSEASKIIDAKYSHTSQSEVNYDIKIEKYTNIISRIKEV